LWCIGPNRRLIVVPLSFPNLRHLRKHRASSTSIGFTACPLSFLSRLRVLYLCWAVYTPIPSCVGSVSTTSPCADNVSTASPTVNYNVRPRALPKPRAPPKSRVPYHIEQRVYHPSLYRLLHLLLFMCRLLDRCRPPLLESTTPNISILRKYTALLKISTMSTGYGPRILGRCRPTHSNAIRDSGPQETGGGNLAMHPRSLDSSWRG
jgi:hypothetical protein